MPALYSSALFLFQDAAASASDVHVIMYCEVVLTAIVVLLLLGIAVAGLVIYSKVNKLIKVADAKAQPLIAQATPLVAKGKEIAGHVNDIIADLKPKIAAVTTDLQPKIAAVTTDLQPKIASISSDVTRISGDAARISAFVRTKVEEFGPTVTRVNETVVGFTDTAKDVNVKAKGQVDRVNHMVSDALTTTQHVSRQIQHGIRVPVEKIASWVTAAKIGIENLGERIPFLKHEPAPTRPGGPVPVRSNGSTTSGPTTTYGVSTSIKRDTPPVG